MLRHGKSLAQFFTALYLCLLSLLAQANLNAGFVWLASQQHPSTGAIVSTTDLGYSTKSTWFALRALRLTAAATAEDSASAYLRETSLEDTESLSQLAVAGVTELADGRAVIEALRDRQNDDGGFGDHAGFDSNAYDSSWALAAFNATGEVSEATAKLLYYLIESQSRNGSWPSESPATVARILAELQPWRARYVAVAAVQAAAADYLSSIVVAEEELLRRAIILRSLAVAGYAQTIQQQLATDILAEQQTDGSWGGDVILTASALLALHAAGNPAVSGSGWIKGRVVDSGSGFPLAGVSVSANTLGTSARTDSNGEFLVTYASEGEHNLSFSKSGFEVVVQPVSFAGEITDIGTVGLPMIADSAVIRGQLIDARNGSPIANAAVALTGGSDTTATTAADGRFLFAGLPEADYQLSVALNGYHAIQQYVSLVSGDRQTLDLLLLPDSAVVTGNTLDIRTRIVDGRNGEGIAGALFNLDGFETVQALEDGAVIVPGVAPGNYVLSVTAAGYSPRLASLYIPAGASGYIASIMLYPREAAPAPADLNLHFTVLDAESSAAVAGASITLLHSGNTTITNAAGAASINGLSVLTEQLQIAAEGYLPASLGLDVAGFGNYSQTIYLLPSSGSGSRIFGQVSDAVTAMPLTGAQVRYAGGFNAPAPALSDTNGNYEFVGLNSDDVTLTVSAANYRTQITHFPIETSHGLNIDYSPRMTPGVDAGAGLKGRVTDWVTKTGMANIPIGFVTDTASGEVFTDANGYFLIDQLQDEEITLTIVADGYDQQDFPVGLTVNTITDIRNIRLIPTGHEFAYHLTGRVVDSDTREPLAGVQVDAVFGDMTLKAITAADGSFGFADLAVPMGRVSLFLDGYIDTSFSLPLIPDEVLDTGELLLKAGTGYLLQPDLTLTNVWTDQVATDPATGLAQGTVQAMLTNFGFRYSGATPITLTAYYDADDNGTYDRHIDTELGHSLFDQLLPREGEVSVPIAVHGVLPFRGAPIAVAVDTGEVLYEQNENNNSSSATSSCASVQTDFSERRSLDNWSVLALPNTNGHGGRPNWVLSDGNYLVNSTSNSPQSGLLAPDESNGTYVWSMEVRTRSDDDGQGFLWGLQNWKNYYQFAWDQGNCRCMRLQSVVGGAVLNQVRNLNFPWTDNTRYYGYLDYQPGRSRVTIERASDGAIMEEFVLNDATYASGRFGFWNNSQSRNYFELFASERVATSDLAVGKLVVTKQGDDYILSAEIGNGGAIAAPQGSSVRIYRGEPSQGRLFLAELDVSGLASNSSIIRSAVSGASLQDGDLIVAVADQQAAVNECRENNNQQQLNWTVPTASLELSVSVPELTLHDDQLLTAEIVNLSSVAQDYSLRWFLLDASGARIDLPEQSLATMAVGTSIHVSTVWTAAPPAPAGTYAVMAELVASNASAVATDNAFFSLAVAISETPVGDGSDGAYGVDVDTDKQQYQVWEQVLLDSRVLNQTLNTVQEPALAKVQVLDPAGEVVLYEEYVVDRLYSGTSERRQHLLSLHDALTGTYSVSIDLLSADGSEMLAHNSVSFDVTAVATTALSGAVSASRRQITAGESLVCEIEASNRSSISEYAGSLLFTVMNAETAAIAYSETITATLHADANLTRSFAIESSQLDEGNYLCTLSATSGEAEKLLGFAGFRLLAEPVSLGLELAHSDHHRLLALVDAAAECTPLNSVDAEIKLKPRWFGYRDKSVRVTVFSGDSKPEFEQILQGGDEYNLQNGNLYAKLSMTRNGNLQLHLQQGAALAANYRITATAYQAHTVDTETWLIDTGCGRNLQTHKWQDGYRVLDYSLADESIAVDDRDPFGPADAPPLSRQKVLLGRMLHDSGWSYKLVDNADAFHRELLTGHYDGYALLAERIHLDVWTLKHLREEVYRGAGLLLAGQHDMRHIALSPALGVYPLGRHQQAAGVISASDGLPEDWQVDWPVVDAAVSFGLRGAEVLAHYQLSGASDAGYDHWYDPGSEAGLVDLVTADDEDNHDDPGWQFDYRYKDARCAVDTHAEHTGNNSWDAYASACDVSWRDVKATAVTRNNYGLGIAVSAGFDWLMQAAAEGEPGPFYEGLQSALKMIRPRADMGYPGGSHALQLRISNQAMATPGQISLTLANSELIDARDFVNLGSSWNWSFTVDQDQALTQQLQLLIPDAGQSGSVTALLRVGEAGELSEVALDELNFEASVIPATIEDARNKIQEIIASEGAFPHLSAVQHKLDYVAAQLSLGEYEKAWRSLLLCSSILGFESSTGAMELRLMIDDVVRQAGKKLLERRP